ncbi:hypothetical protein BJ508DRAFT_131664 [Ascobolus immersus RN42]|uniref:Uncharacterized protein n=1 Tax=Ascobolus immersus RN42 TaxID=1160509 RepID=A0A3N4I7F2_ASCIM|nr:hypothetical protein BJ508DRAFT_131664 [Ascobolus immersus RN42]
MAPLCSKNWDDIPDMARDENYLLFKERLESAKEGKFLVSSNGVIKEETMATAGVLLSRKDWCLFCKTHLMDWEEDLTKNQHNKMKMFVDGCYVQFREFGEHVACMNCREKHRAASWPNNLPNPNDYLCRQQGSLAPHFRPFNLDIPEPNDVDEQDDPSFSLMKHYYPDYESDYASSTASSNYDSYDSDLFADEKQHRVRRSPKQKSSPVAFVKSPQAERAARPKPGAYDRKPTVGHALKRKHRESPEPATLRVNKKPLTSRPYGAPEKDAFIRPAHRPTAIRNGIPLKKDSSTPGIRQPIPQVPTPLRGPVMRAPLLPRKPKVSDVVVRHRRRHAAPSLSAPTGLKKKKKVKVPADVSVYHSSTASIAKMTPPVSPVENSADLKGLFSDLQLEETPEETHGEGSLISPPRDEVANQLEMPPALENEEPFYEQEHESIQEFKVEPLSEEEAIAIKRESTPNPLLAYLDSYEPSCLPDVNHPSESLFAYLTHSTQNLDALQRATLHAQNAFASGYTYDIDLESKFLF